MRDLDIILQSYLTPMRNTHAFNTDTLDVVFGNLEDIRVEQV